MTPIDSRFLATSRPSATRLGRRAAVPLAVILALSTAPLLTGCSVNPVQGIVSGATGGKVNVGGTTIPKDFPKSVPLYKGTISTVAAIGSGKNRVFNISIRVPNPDAITSIRSSLEKAGFKTVEEGNVGKNGASLISASSHWGVAVVLVKDGKAYQADYTVTSADKSK